MYRIAYLAAALYGKAQPPVLDVLAAGAGIVAAGNMTQLGQRYALAVVGSRLEQVRWSLQACCPSGACRRRAMNRPVLLRLLPSSSSFIMCAMHGGSPCFPMPMSWARYVSSRFCNFSTYMSNAAGVTNVWYVVYHVLDLRYHVFTRQSDGPASALRVPCRPLPSCSPASTICLRTCGISLRSLLSV